MSVWHDPRGDRWRYKFQIKGQVFQADAVDPVTSEMARNKTDARRIERLAKARAETAVAEKRRTEAKVSRAYTMVMAMAAYTARQHRKPAWRNQKGYVEELLEHFGAETAIEEIEDAAVWTYIEWAGEQPLRVFIGGPAGDRHLAANWQPFRDGRRRSDSTINRYLDSFRMAVGMAARVRDREGVLRCRSVPEVPRLAEPEMNPNPVPDAVIRSLLLNAPQHLAEVVTLTMLMGFRKEEACTLTRRQIDHQNRGIRLGYKTTKGQRDEFMIANSTAWRLLQYLDAQAEARGVDFLIARQVRTDGGGMERRMVKGRRIRTRPSTATFEWRPVKNPKRSWRTEMERQGVDYRFHDLKGSFSSGLAPLVQSGKTVQRLSRHSDGRTTDRYIAFADPTLRGAVETIAHRPAVAGIDMSQPLGRIDGKSRSTEAAPPPGEPDMTLPNILKRVVGATGFEPATSSPPDVGSSSQPLISFKKAANDG